jgi:hypothetical protein
MIKLRQEYNYLTPANTLRNFSLWFERARNLHLGAPHCYQPVQSIGKLLQCDFLGKQRKKPPSLPDGFSLYK